MTTRWQYAVADLGLSRRKRESDQAYGIKGHPLALPGGPHVVNPANHLND